jgi:hypothetical protein
VKPKNKRQKDLSHFQGNEGYDYGLEYIPIFICTIHYIMTFAFINIHLDIYRIIIIIPQKTDASAMRKNFEERGNFHASLCTKEGKVFFAFGSKVKFRSQQSRLYTDKGD